MHILIAAAEALGHEADELILNRSTANRMRQENRLNQSKDIQEQFIDRVI